MTYQELGLQLRKLYPHLKDQPGDDVALAHRFLNAYPEYYDLVSPTARRIKEVSERLPSSSRLTEKGRLESIAQQVEINRAEAQSLLEMDVAIRAAGEGLTLPTYEQMRLLVTQADQQIRLDTHRTEETIRLETFRRDSGLDGAKEHLLTPQALLAKLRKELNDLIDLRDAETHPEKREAMTIEIQARKEDLRARGQQIVVQAGGGSGMGQPDENAHGAGSSEPSAEGDPNQVSASNSGTSKRRPGFVS